MRSEPLGCAIVGLGPAGAGFLFNAFKSGKCERLAAHGLLILDGANSVGDGRLGEYQVSANSVNDVFLNCLVDPAFGNIFMPLQHLPAYQRMRANPKSVSMLPEVATVLGAATELLVAHIERTYGVFVRRASRVESVIRRGEHFDLRVCAPDGSRYEVRTASVVMNIGGTQTPRLLRDALREMSLVAPEEDERMLTSDHVLSEPAAALRAHFSQLMRGSRSLVVVGGSHSAFSVLERLAVELEAVGLKEIVLLHRSPIKLFFETREAAQQAGYVFDEEHDVCPVSGRINRSGGLRYRAFEIGGGVLTDGMVPGTRVKVRTLPVGGGDAVANADAQGCLSACAGVIQCTGYQPCLPELLRDDGEPVALREIQGGLDSDAAGCPCDTDGRRIEGLHLFGLGSGLAVDPKIGSEASFHGRIYGIWQFHHDASRPALERVLTKAAWHEQLAHSQTLHHYRLGRGRR